eukprot:30234-Prorocentrum_minimum.AAC.2
MLKFRGWGFGNLRRGSIQRADGASRQLWRLSSPWYQEGIDGRDGAQAGMVRAHRDDCDEDDDVEGGH